jgi:hypothetical protein
MKKNKYTIMAINTFFTNLQKTKPLLLLMVIAPICGSIVTIYNFGKIYDGLGLPRPVFYNEFTLYKNALKQQVVDLEVEYRTRAIKSDLKAVRDIQKEIQTLLDKNIPVPDSILEQKATLEENIHDNRDKLKKLSTDDTF